MIFFFYYYQKSFINLKYIRLIIFIYKLIFFQIFVFKTKFVKLVINNL